ncbi:MAG: NYN domain-containing protein [Verrucomicrobiota bacterium]|nr:NYN domain-containing protein [Verrucomicrobiota bacterium]
MYYYVDGYNLIFSFPESRSSLLDQREVWIDFLRKAFVKQQICGVIVFDGRSPCVVPNIAQDRPLKQYKAHRKSLPKASPFTKGDSLYLNVRQGDKDGVPLDIVYTTEGETADSYILQCLEISRKCDQITVVTRDNLLKREVCSRKARTMHPHLFVEWLSKTTHASCSEKPEKEESRRHRERLLKAFSAAENERPQEQISPKSVRRKKPKQD